MEKLQEQGRSDAFFFGFEESLGYLYGDYTRDKDGVLAPQRYAFWLQSKKNREKHWQIGWRKFTESTDTSVQADFPGYTKVKKTGRRWTVS